jgi:phosphoserine phosphatase
MALLEGLSEDVLHNVAITFTHSKRSAPIDACSKYYGYKTAILSEDLLILRYLQKN